MEADAYRSVLSLNITSCSVEIETTEQSSCFWTKVGLGQIHAVGRERGQEHGARGPCSVALPCVFGSSALLGVEISVFSSFLAPTVFIL